MAGMPKGKAALYAFGVAMLLGGIASRDREIRDGLGDQLFDHGEVVEVIENRNRFESFLSVFLFTAVPMAIGIRNAECESTSNEI
jgi:hypothetical protein